jgi:hypothetical protein
MTAMVDKIVACHDALTEAGMQHAFGGALALAWCTQSARGTIDIDINLFVGVEHAEAALQALPQAVKQDSETLATLRRDTQIRLWWDHTPVDVFLNNTDFHEQASQRIRWEAFAERKMPFLSCRDLAVFKAFFNRTKDWADLEAMQEAGTLDLDFVSATLVHYLGADDERIAKLQAL